jgi:uncharacterized membrane protein YfcA
MGLFLYRFPISGVEVSVLVPPLVALVVSFFTSMGGVSGAFLLLPFQVSLLNYTSPSVSATNFVYNIVSIPGGVWRFIREGRMAWPLTWVVILGTLPGVFLGYFIRIKYLLDPKPFKFFVGLVLFYIGIRLLYELTPRAKAAKGLQKGMEEEFHKRMRTLKREGDKGVLEEARVKVVRVGLDRISYRFWGQEFSFNTVGMFFLALVVGIIGGAYGIGGGAIIAPFCVTVFELPVYTVAGAALMGTFITSVAGVIFYSLITQAGHTTSPDWLLGGLFGLGGLLGIYLGARFQKYVSQDLIKFMLGIIILYTSARYIYQFFR